VGCSFSVFVWVGGQTVVQQQREKSKIFRGGGKRVEMRGCPAKPEMQFVILCNDLWQLIAAPPLAPRNFPQCAPDRKTRKPQYLFFVAIFSFRVFSDICFLPSAFEITDQMYSKFGIDVGFSSRFLRVDGWNGGGGDLGKSPWELQQVNGS